VLAETTLEKVRQQGYVRVGFANEAPFGYATPDGKLTGEAPEVAKAVLARMGIPEVDGVLTEFGSLIPGLKAGRFDIIAAGMFITPKRCKQIGFSEPSYGIGQAFLVPDGNPKQLNTYADVAQQSDIKLAVMAGAIERSYAKKAGVALNQLVTLPDPPSMLAAVQAKRADAAALTALSIANLASKGDGVESTEHHLVSQIRLPGDVAGVIIQQQDLPLLPWFAPSIRLARTPLMDHRSHGRTTIGKGSRITGVF
jgi:polar amino acid transport system substrate-binding protein